MNITAVVVCYNTPELIHNCIASFRKFYKEIPIVIIDNSEFNTPCFQMCDRLSKEYQHVRVQHTLRNIGHGRGMHLGINMSYTKYVLIMDSDTEMIYSCLEMMEEQLTENVYGTGLIVQVDQHGKNVRKGIDYIHPHFALINKFHYDNNQPFVHHGAPCIKTMLQLRLQRVLSLKPFAVNKYVLHKERGTLKVIAKLQDVQRVRKPYSTPSIPRLC